METKPFWQSKTFWINVVAIVATLTGMFGIDLGLDPETQLAAVATIMYIINIILRLFFTGKAIKIKSTGKKPTMV